MKKEFLKKVILAAMVVSVVDKVTITEAHAAWQQNKDNQWSWSENEKKAVGWKLIDNKWYSFDDNGIMRTGWFKDNDNKWYYLMPSGEMKTGWLLDGKWYYFSSSGAMVTGWFKDSNEKWYYLSSNGAMVTGWFKDSNGRWYYLSSNGAMVTGWLTLNDKKYYMDSDGAMVTGKVTIEGEEFNFASSGELIVKTEVSIPDVDSKEEEPQEPFEVKTAYVITQSGSLNLREEPSTTGKIIEHLPKGSEIKITGKEVNGFLPVTYGTSKGWASSSWIGPVKPVDNNSSAGTSSPGNSTSNSTNSSSDNVIVKPDFSKVVPRTQAPDTKNLYYYSDENIFYKARYSPPFYRNGKQIIGNCTWYAWGRAWEMSGTAPIDAGFNGNAYEWWEANKRTGKYNYGSTPKKGAIAVWKPSMNSSGLGHVAIVEKIENGKIYISESAWQGVLFRYREMYQPEHLYGYIYLDEPKK